MPGPLRDFVLTRLASKWEVRGGRFRLESQSWKGEVWRHDILVAEPPQGWSDDTAILEITGDNVADEDLVWAKKLAAESGLPVFVLCQIPNQPLWDLREDHLIAHTFERCLDDGDPTWPLLCPMTRAAASALDAIQEWSKGSIRRFIVTGASKRGWTTWLLGATGDPRVIGLAPRLFDNLHFLRQIEKQQRYWNGFSSEIDPYVQRGLPERFATPEGLELLKIVDPWYALSDIKIPVLLIHGALDPFWMVDALAEYWSDIASPKWCLISPFRGHELWPTEEWAPTMTAFSEACREGLSLPEPEMTCDRRGHRFTLRPHPAVREWRMNALVSEGRRLFTPASEVVQFAPDSEEGCTIQPLEHADLAVFPTIQLELGGSRFPVSLPPVVIDRMSS